MKQPSINNKEINFNNQNFEPSDDDLKKIEEEVKRLLNKDFS